MKFTVNLRRRAITVLCLANMAVALSAQEVKPNQVYFYMPSWNRYYSPTAKITGLWKTMSSEGAWLMHPYSSIEADDLGYGFYGWSDEQSSDGDYAAIIPGHSCPIVRSTPEWQQIAYNYGSDSVFFPWVWTDEDNIYLHDLLPLPTDKDVYTVGNDHKIETLLFVIRNGRFKDYAFMIYRDMKGVERIYIGGMADGKVAFGNATDYSVSFRSSASDISYINYDDGDVATMIYGSRHEFNGAGSAYQHGLDFRKLDESTLEKIVKDSRPLKYECVAWRHTYTNRCALTFINPKNYPYPNQLKLYRVFTRQ